MFGQATNPPPQEAEAPEEERCEQNDLDLAANPGPPEAEEPEEEPEEYNFAKALAEVKLPLQPGLPSEITRECAQRLSVRSLGCLRAVADRICCVLTHADLMIPGLADIGYNCVVPPGEFQRTAACANSIDAFLVVGLGAHLPILGEMVKALSLLPDAPPMIVVILIPGWETFGNEGLPAPDMSTEERMDYEAELGKSLSKARSALYEIGADDVCCLFDGEQLRPYRVLEILEKSEFMAKILQDIISSEKAAAQKSTTTRITIAYKKFLQTLPGRVLQAIPREDPSLVENTRGNSLVGVGGFNFTSKVSQGAFGWVFKATHAQYGECVVKVIPKAIIARSANSLVCLDREISLSKHLDKHPNFVRTLTVMNTKQHIYVALEYCGSCNLHSYAKEHLRHTGRSLPAVVVRSFTSQQASAVEHLHGSLVCHRNLKPEIWTVSPVGDTLRLSDMGLARQVVHVNHHLNRSCGSLPFCAPEVFTSDKTGPGYNGFAADIWSLGVGWMELVNGPYSVERMLGWFPRHPEAQQDIMNGLHELPLRWQRARHGGGMPQLVKLITEMVVFQSERRRTITQVAGPEGLHLKRQAPTPRRGSNPDPHRHATVKQKTPRKRTGAKEDQRKALNGLCLTARVGGFSVVSAAFEHMFDVFLSIAGFGQAIAARPAKDVARLRELYVQEIPSTFDSTWQSTEEAALRVRIQGLHHGIPMSRSHVRVMAQILLKAFVDFGVSSKSAAEAVARFKDLHPEICSAWAPSLVAAAERNTPEWRQEQIGSLRPSSVAAFGQILVDSVEADAILRMTGLRELRATEVEAHLMEYFRQDGWMENISPVPLARESLSQQAQLAYVEAARAALMEANFPQEVVQTLYCACLGQWRNKKRAAAVDAS